MPRPFAAASRSTLLVALLAGLIAFGAAFAAARTLSDDDADPARSGQVEVLPQTVVPINNLERAPSIKPLRSAAGTPAPAAPAAQAPEPGAAP